MAKVARIFGKSVDGKEETRGFVCIHCPGCECLHTIATKEPFSNGAIWNFNNNFEKPTFLPSLLIRTGKYVPGHEDFDDEGFKEFNTICHSFITNGMIQFLNDCTHNLKGQTIALPEIPD